MKNRVLTVSVKPGAGPTQPFIFIGGKWLRECGFDIGRKVLVECKAGLLSIKTIDLESNKEERR